MLLDCFANYWGFDVFFENIALRIYRGELEEEYATLDVVIDAGELRLQEEEGASRLFTPRDVTIYNSREILRFEKARPEWIQIE